MKNTSNKIIIILLAIGVVLLAYIAFKPKNETKINNPASFPIEQTSKNQLNQETPSRDVTLDTSDQYTKKYQTTFSAALKKQADFNGHYVVASYGCGSGCLAYGVIDKNTGKAYQGPSDDYGGSYQVPSNFESQRYSIDSNTFKVIGYNKIQTYVFTNGMFTLVD